VGSTELEEEKISCLVGCLLDEVLQLDCRVGISERTPNSLSDGREGRKVALGVRWRGVGGFDITKAYGISTEQEHGNEKP